MAKLALICLTAILIGFAKYIAGPVILKGMDIDFAQSMMGTRILHQAKPGATRIVFKPQLRDPAKPDFTLPPPDLPPEPDIEPVQ